MCTDIYIPFSVICIYMCLGLMTWNWTPYGI